MAETPNHTLYIKNLDSKLNFDTLRHHLYLLFSTYGNIIKIYLKPGIAHIVFANIDQATLAKKVLSGEMFFNKQLVIEFAHQDSKLIEDALQQDDH